MYHVSAQGVDERMINVHYYYNTSNFSAVHMNRNPFSCSYGERKRALIVSNLALLSVVFRVTGAASMAVKGLKLCLFACLYFHHHHIGFSQAGRISFFVQWQTFMSEN